MYIMQAIRIRIGHDRNGNTTFSAKCQAKMMRTARDQGKPLEADILDFARNMVSRLGWQDYGTWSVGQFDDRDYFVTCYADNDSRTHLFWRM